MTAYGPSAVFLYASDAEGRQVPGQAMLSAGRRGRMIRGTVPVAAP